MKLSTLIKTVKSVKSIYEKFMPCFIQDSILKANGKRILSQIEFHIVDHCNLNCAHCDHFTPVAPEWYADINKILSDFKQLAKIYDNIEHIYVLGGEPLLHPNLLDIFKPLRELFPDSEIALITNGILLEKQDEVFWETLQKYKIALTMTKYPIKVDYKKFLNKCESLGIKSYFFCGERDQMYAITLNYKGDTDINKVFHRCCRKRCHFLRDGKLYVCTLVPNIRFLNKYFNLDFKVFQKDYIDIYRVKSATKINRFLSKPFPFCRYCPKEVWKKVDYSISKREISEWVDTETLS